MNSVKLPEAIKEAGKKPEGPLWGGIEAGGTKFVCAVGTGPDTILTKQSFPTRSPEQTLPQVLDFFHAQTDKFGDLAGIGMGCFGPVDIDTSSPTWGQIIATPKPGWSGVAAAKLVAEGLGVPVTLETDVNAALLAEAKLGAGRGIQDLAYITVGTGVGGGLMSGGQLVHGLMHPELGHMVIGAHPEDMTFEGACSFHGRNCVEGMASGPAIAARWGQKGPQLPETHPAWEIEAYYLAQLCANIVLTVSPRRIILGGGVMQQTHLFPLIRQQFKKIVAGYVPLLDDDTVLEQFIVPPVLGQQAGLCGALLLAEQAVAKPD